MKLRPFNKTLLIIGIFGLLLFNGGFVFASSFSDQCDAARGRLMDNNDAARNPMNVILVACVIQQVINIALGMLGAGLIIMVAYGAIKAVMATGEPKGLLAAKMTWTWAIYGAMIVLGAYVIILIAMRLMGINSWNPLAITDRLGDALGTLVANLLTIIEIDQPAVSY